MATSDYDFDVFVSHASADNPRVADLAQRLRDRGLDVWVDVGSLRPGDHIYLSIEDALERSRALLMCLTNTSVQRPWVDFERATILFDDPTNRGGRFIPVLLEDCDIPPAMRAFKYIDYRQHRSEALELIVEACEAAGNDRRHRVHRQPSPASQKRTRYLRDMRKSIENIQSESIHRARFIDLGLDDSPDSIQTPLLYENPARRESLDSLWQAYEKAHERLLILGEPGSGKSTSLYDLALKLVARAEADPDAPVPFVQTLSTFPLRVQARGSKVFRWRFGAQDVKQVSVADWLTAQLSAKGGIAATEAATWIEMQRVVFLLDGLDEVHDEWRIEFAVRLNHTLLNVWPDLPVVVCSRTHEYVPIRDRDEARLRLRGAAILQPLNREAILSYARAARAEALEATLRQDSRLMNMASSPLMLSLMTLAYGGNGQHQFRLDGSETERRLGLMKDYVDRMLQRVARKERGRPTDVPGHDVPENEYRYSRSRVHDYLGWLSVRMSMRMRTSVQPWRIFGFLADIEGELPVRDGIATGSAVAFLIAACAFLTSMPLLLRQPDMLPVVLAVTALIPMAGLIGRALAAGGGMKRTILTVGAVALALALAVLSLAQFARSLPLLLPWIGNPLTGGFVALVTWAATFSILFGLADDERAPQWSGVGVVAAIYLPVITGIWRHYPVSPVVLIASATRVGPLLVEGNSAIGLVLFTNAVIATAIVIVILVVKQNGILGLPWLYLSLPFVPVFALGVVKVLLSVPGQFTLWVVVLETGLFTVYGVLYGLRTSRHLAIPIVVAAIGSALPPHAAPTFLLIAFTAVLFWEGTNDDAKDLEEGTGGWLRRTYRALASASERAIDIVFLTPLTWCVLCATRQWPWRRRSFVTFCSVSLLLRYTSEYEFVHRRLRDYFALSGLLPRLQSAITDERIKAIEALGFQGDAAVETLIDLVREGRSAIAVAAAKALGRSSSSEALVGIREAATHQDALVRAAMMGALHNISRAEASGLIENAVTDRERDVVVAALKMHKALGPSRASERFAGEREQLLQKGFESARDRAALLAALVGTEILANIDAPPLVLMECVAALGQADDHSAGTYLRLLSRGRFYVPALKLAPFTAPAFSETTRTAALDALVSCAPREAAPYVLEALRSRERKLADHAMLSWRRLAKDVRVSTHPSAEWAQIAATVAQVESERQQLRAGMRLRRWLAAIRRSNAN